MALAQQARLKAGGGDFGLPEDLYISFVPTYRRSAGLSMAALTIITAPASVDT